MEPLYSAALGLLAVRVPYFLEGKGESEVGGVFSDGGGETQTPGGLSKFELLFF